MQQVSIRIEPFMSIIHVAKTLHKFPNNPIANDLKIITLSLLIPSTASSIEPSTPRKAFPDPHIDVIVAKDTHEILAQIEIIALACKNRTAYASASSGTSSSIRHVVVNPANTAAWVAMEEKFSVNKLSSFSLNLIADCLKCVSNSVRSAANILLVCVGVVVVNYAVFSC